MSDSIERLYASVLAARAADSEASRTARLMRDGISKMAKKVAEEAVEVSIDAVAGNRRAGPRKRRSNLQSRCAMGRVGRYAP